MWIETESGAYLNAAGVLLIEKLAFPEPGSTPSDAGFAEGLRWRVRAYLSTDDQVMLTGELTEAEAEALMPRILSGVRFAKYLSVAEEVRQVRAMLAKGGA